jgi:helix-turn-helix protein
VTREVSTITAAKRLGVSASTVLNWLRAGRLAGRRGDQPLRQRWYVTVDDDGRPLAPDGTPIRAADDDSSIVEELRLLRAAVERTERLGTASEVALRLKAAGERQRRALELQAEAINELAAALHEQGEAIAQLLLPDTVAQFTDEAGAAITS